MTPGDKASVMLTTTRMFVEVKSKDVVLAVEFGDGKWEGRNLILRCVLIREVLCFFNFNFWVCFVHKRYKIKI